MKTRLEKFRVCDQCMSVGITDPSCVCSDSNYKTIELEFEVCDCCGHVICDQPADTEFNLKQLNSCSICGLIQGNHKLSCQNNPNKLPRINLEL